MSQRDRKFIESLVLCGTLFVTWPARSNRARRPRQLPAVAPSARHTVVQNQGPIRRVVLITIDGLKPENYLRPDDKVSRFPRCVGLQGRALSATGYSRCFRRSRTPRTPPS